MIFLHTELCIQTPQRGFTDVTHVIEKTVSQADIEQGIVTLFIRHTSASLIISESTDPAVREDLEVFLSRLVPDGHPDFQHIWEGKDDMSAHIRSVLTTTSLSIPVQEGRLYIGRWQAIYLWEHRYHSHSRFISVSLMGESYHR